MYTVCTVRPSRAIDAAFLLAIPRVFVYVALGAWSLAFLGLLLELRPERRVATPAGRFDQ